MYWLLEYAAEISDHRTNYDVLNLERVERLALSFIISNSQRLDSPTELYSKANVPLPRYQQKYKKQTFFMILNNTRVNNTYLEATIFTLFCSTDGWTIALCIQVFLLRSVIGISSLIQLFLSSVVFIVLCMYRFLQWRFAVLLGLNRVASVLSCRVDIIVVKLAPYNVTCAAKKTIYTTVFFNVFCTDVLHILNNPHVL